jgi:hypothetical protein
MSLRDSFSGIAKLRITKVKTMPENKEPLQGGQPIRGKSYGTFTVSQAGYNGNIPPTAFEALKHEAAGLLHGTASLTIHVKDGHLLRYVTNRERSFVPGRTTTGDIHNE